MNVRVVTHFLLASVFAAGRLPAQIATSQQPQSAPPAAAASPTAPSPSSSAPTVRVYVNRVVLDVVVTDAKGNVVTGLTQSDFHLTDAGEAQSITNFDIASRHTVPVDTTIHSTADLDKFAPDAPVNIILLDEFNTLFEDMAFARYSLKKSWRSSLTS